MSFDRRRFLEVAGFAGAGLLVGCGKSKSNPEPTGAPGPTGQSTAPPAAPSGASLSLLLWGSSLYAFSNGGTRLEVAYLLDDPHVSGCTFVPHHPMLELPSGGAKVVPGPNTIKLGPDGDIPKGVYKIQTGSIRPGAPRLNAVGLNGTPSGCAGPASTVTSLAYVPTLKAKSSTVGAKWRNRFATRFVFDYGELSAHAPFHGESALARWEVRGPDAGVPVWPFTDTLQLTIPLKDNTVTFENEHGELLVLATSGDPAMIEARLMAHPEPVKDEPLRVGDKEPHFCALYAAFDPVPAPHDRAEIFFKDWCPVSATMPPAPPPGVPTGPSPGRYCTGAKIAI